MLRSSPSWSLPTLIPLGVSVNRAWSGLIPYGVYAEPMLKRVVTLIVALMSVAALTAGCSSSGATNQSAADFTTTVATPGVVTIDVRTPAEFAAGHIPGAVNIDVEGGLFDAQIAELDPATTYAVYCHSGRRSGIAVRRMGDAGFTSLVNLDGGIQTWTGPLVTGTA